MNHRSRSPGKTGCGSQLGISGQGMMWARAIQFWLWDAKGQQPLEAEGIGVECLADILDTVGA